VATLGITAEPVAAAGVSPLMGDAGFIIRVNALGTVNVTEAAGRPPCSSGSKPPEVR
jgi:hypothetical protein